MQWWSPRIANTASDVYTNFVCTQPATGAGTVVTRNTASDFTPLVATDNLAATNAEGTGVTLAGTDITVSATIDSSVTKLWTGCQIRLTLGSSANPAIKLIKYGDTLSYRAGFKSLVGDVNGVRSDAQTADFTFAIVDGAVALAVGAAISSVMVNFF